MSIPAPPKHLVRRERRVGWETVAGLEINTVSAGCPPLGKMRLIGGIRKEKIPQKIWRHTMERRSSQKCHQQRGELCVG